MLQIEFLGIGNHGVAEAAGFQRSKRIFLAPHPIDFIEILGADGRIRFTPDVSLGIHEIKDIVVVTFDRFPVFPDTVTLRKLKVVGNKPLQAFKCPQEDTLGFSFHLLCKIRIVSSVHRLFLGGQHKLSAIKSVTAVIQGLQITVTECQQPGEHPALITLLAFTFQIHLALCCHDGFYIVGLAQSFHPHIIIYAQQDVLQIGTGKAVFRNLADAAVLHVCAKDSRKHRTDLGFTLATVALNHHHALSFVGGDQAITDKLLQGGNVFRMEQSIQKVQPDHGRRSIGIVDNRQTASHDSRSALGKCAVQ